MVLSETRGLRLSWVIRGGIGLTRRLCAKGTGLQAIWILTLEPERLKNGLATTRNKSMEMDGRSLRRASGLQFQFLCVEVFSFFPKCQRDGCDLACQCEACHGWLDALGDCGLIKLLQGSGPCAGSGSHRFEQTFQIVVL